MYQKKHQTPAIIDLYQFVSIFLSNPRFAIRTAKKNDSRICFGELLSLNIACIMITVCFKVKKSNQRWIQGIWLGAQKSVCKNFGAVGLSISHQTCYSETNGTEGERTWEKEIFFWRWNLPPEEHGRWQLYSKHFLATTDSWGKQR